MALKPLASSPAGRIFSSLADSRPWTLTRTLRSENPADINGVLRGTASFTGITGNTDSNGINEILYREEGEMPGAGGSMAGLRWSRKYIWRLSTAPSVASTVEDGDEVIGVWFVKLQKPPTDTKGANGSPVGDRDEADYVFHELEFRGEIGSDEGVAALELKAAIPPPVSEADTRIMIAHGQHLCVKDDYETIYAFRVANDPPGQVLSWSSRHIVIGPRKHQDIMNLYSRDVIDDR
ncbi:hypothetical protein FQN55_008890 [Onygenales sp. PD_40]|nr:hypothetical protein FQN55_008890 [Onygenales sp. PD_40]KAK2781767.1 hypothetical protein FQN52_001351 [Onygenales sp. PD_12]